MTTSTMTPSPPPRDCHAVVRALWDYLDGALDDADMKAIDAHLAACAQCRTHSAFERRLILEIRALRARRAGIDPLREQVLGMLRRARGVGPVS